MSEILKKIYFLGFVALVLTSCSVFNKSKNNSGDDQRVKNFNFNYHFLEANKQKILGNFNGALENYQLALQVDPSQASVCYEIAGILNMGGDHAGALKYAEQSVKLDKTENKYYLQLLAYIYQTNNMPEKSVKVYEKLLDADQGNIHYYFEITDIFMQASEHENAIKILNQAEKHFGIQDMISLEKEKCYLSIGNKQKALEEIEKLCKAYPENVKFKTILAESYLNTGDVVTAGKIYDEIEKMIPSEGLIYFSMADYYLLIRDYEKTFSVLEKAYTCTDVELDVKVKMTLTLLEITSSEKALSDRVGKLLQILIRNYPDELMVRALNADFLMFQQDYKSAQKEFDYILGRDKNKYEIWEQVLELDYVLVDMPAMYRHGKEATELFPNVLDLYRYYIISAYSTEKYEEIVTAVDYASDLAVSDQELLVEFLGMQAEAFHKLGNYEKSDSVYNLILFKDSENIAALNNYSYFLALRGEHLDKALEMSAKLVELDPKVAAYLDTHAWVLYKNKMWEEALSYINEALSTEPSNVVFLEHKGDILFRSGKIDEAVQTWINAAEFGKGSDKLEQKISTKTLIE